MLPKELLDDEGDDVLELQDVVKRYGDTTALDGLSLAARPGAVTGFLGPNGAGKSTALRVLLGLDRPDEGRALVLGRPYAERRAPLLEVGALLDAKAVAPRRGARPHLLALARSNGIPVRRVQEVLEVCGLEDVADRPVGQYSLGMGQRLGIAAALLGDPPVLVLDEPVNGLDPDGIIWIRRLLRALAAEGRTVLLSSHLMSEMAMTAEDLVVVGRGRLITQTTVAEVVARAGRGRVVVRTPEPERLAGLLRTRGTEVAVDDDDPTRLHLSGTSTDDTGRLAAQHGVTLLELSAEQGSLEQAYLELTAGAAQFRGADPPGSAARGARPAVGGPAGRQLGRVVAAEWVKARSVPSTWSALGSAVFIMASIGPAVAGLDGGQGAAASEPLLQVMAGAPMTQVALGVLGALLMTQEYASRSITGTLAAVPQRGTLLAGKAVLLVLLVTPFALLSCTLAALTTLPVLRDRGYALALPDPEVVTAVLATTLVLVLTALLGLAVGTLLRSTAGGVVVLTGLLFLLPVLAQLVPGLRDTVAPWLPTQAGSAVLVLGDRTGYLSPLAGQLLLAGCTAVALAVATARLRRSDA